MQTTYPTQRREAVLTGLHADRVGTASTAVLRFIAAPVFNEGLGTWLPTEWINVVNDAALGTVVTLLRRGVYSVKLMTTVPATGAGAFGISWNAPAASLLAAVSPINTAVGIRAGAHAIAPASTQIPVTLESSIVVAGTQLAAGTTILRFHGNDGSTGALAAGGVIAAQVRAQIEYLGDLQGL